jgi:hypothetical protein
LNGVKPAPTTPIADLSAAWRFVMSGISNGMNGADAEAPVGTQSIEEMVGMLEGVRGVRVVDGDHGEVREVHVLAGSDRSAKQIVRDVQSILLTRFGLEVDYRRISVAQLDVPRAEPAEAPSQQSHRARTIVSQVTVTVAGQRAQATVKLSRGDETLEGVAEGSVASTHRVVARAAVEAANSASLGTIDVEVAEVLTAGAFHIALTILRVSGGRGDHVLTGAAVVRSDANDAVARAVLDALNRILDQT